MLICKTSCLCHSLGYVYCVKQRPNVVTRLLFQNKKLKIRAYAMERLKRNAPRRWRNLNALKNVPVQRRNLNVPSHAQMLRNVKTKISQRIVHASLKWMQERNAKVLKHLRARRNATVIVKKGKPKLASRGQVLLQAQLESRGQVLLQALCNPVLPYRLSMASAKR